MKPILLCALLILSIGSTSGLPKFIRGRNFYKQRSVFGAKQSNITDFYFNQRLDHFNEATKTTWKQVSIFLIF